MPIMIVYVLMVLVSFVDSSGVAWRGRASLGGDA